MEGNLVSGGDQTYQAADGIVAEVPEINQQTVRQAIDVRSKSTYRWRRLVTLVRYPWSFG
ncbi:hypothetical protein L861_14715 [Litchfieldella anticariensis FP35 = DSM 16096]|uniref:Uncharacterized protein n=2 Tax=Litchfieldella anticariensis TaxID=258591 RepID=S2KXP3_LITA3|nr:hypothetical protein L861_14715 [Halomonas anticariensis FP35 = DSM 16096]